MLLLVFSLILLVAALLSEFSDRSIFSTSLLFLLGGAACAAIGVDRASMTSEKIQSLVNAVLVFILFTDGMKTRLQELRESWRLPGRALLLGFPLTLVLTALIARLVVGLNWIEAFIVGAALTPTDPVLVTSLVGSESVPYRLRYLLNVESGLNDGLALPALLVLIALAGHSPAGLGDILYRVAMGVVVGIVIPWGAIRIQGTRFLGINRVYQTLIGFAIILLVFSVTAAFHFNEYLAAFSAGITMASLSPELKERFAETGEILGELLKLAALFFFGTLISFSFLRETSAWIYLSALLILVLARPLAIEFSLLGSRLSQEERIIAAWFGPKGFASVIFALLIINRHVENENLLFHQIAIVAVISMIIYPAADIPVSKWFVRHQPPGPRQGDMEGGG